MLPSKLGEDLVSLKPGEDRFAFSVVFIVDASGTIEGEPWIGKTIVKNDTNLLYGTVDCLVSGEGGEIEESLKEAVGALLVRNSVLRNPTLPILTVCITATYKEIS
jgi:exoribonuclease R